MKTEELFQKNMALLHEYLRKQVEQVDLEQLWNKVEIFYSEEGQPVCKYRNDRGVFQINSIKPDREAANWCSHLPLEDTGALFIYGCGFGYPLLEILKKKPANTIVIVFEQSLDIFAAMLHYMDMEPILQSGKFIFFLGCVEDFGPHFNPLFWSSVMLYCTAPAVVFTSSAQRHFKAEYSKIHNYVFETFALNVTFLGNDHYDTLLGLHNIIDNIQEVIENPYLSSLKDQFKHVPVFIVANGPSLDKNIQQLKKIDGKGLIFACESAILPLMRNGIKPDAICILERIPEVYQYHFENRDYPDSITLLPLVVIDKRILPTFHGPRIPIFRTAETNNKWINRLVGDESGLFAGANVAVMALELATYLGADPIVFVGQDLAFGSDGYTHSKDSIYAEESLKKHVDRIRSSDVIYVEGNDGTQIPTTHLWFDFKQGLERLMEMNRNITYLNATEGGAKIIGTKCDTLTNVIETYCTRALDCRLDTLIRKNKKKINLDERRKKLCALMDELNEYAGIYQDLSRQSMKNMLKCQKMILLAEKDDLSGVLKTLEQEYENNYAELYKFMDNKLHACFLQQVIFVGFHKINRLGTINSPERIKQIFQIFHNMFDQLNVICQSLVVNFEMASEKLEAKLSSSV